MIQIDHSAQVSLATSRMFSTNLPCIKLCHDDEWHVAEILLKGCSRRASNFHTAEVLPSVSKVAGVWRSLFWCLGSVMLWRGIMGFTKFGDKRVNDLDLLSGYVVGVACLHRENPCRRICMQLAPRTS